MTLFPYIKTFPSIYTLRLHPHFLSFTLGFAADKIKQENVEDYTLIRLLKS